MCKRTDGKTSDAATTGRIYKVYREWCNDNNHGYAKTAKEFREALAAHLGSTFKDISVHTNKGTYYRDFTLTPEAKEQYSKVYGYDDTEFLS